MIVSIKRVITNDKEEPVSYTTYPNTIVNTAKVRKKATKKKVLLRILKPKNTRNPPKTSITIAKNSLILSKKFHRSDYISIGHAAMVPTLNMYFLLLFSSKKLTKLRFTCLSQFKYNVSSVFNTLNEIKINIYTYP
jgi:hypothetical protein